MSSIKTRLIVALAVSLVMTVAMAGLLYFGARGLDSNAARTHQANDDVQDLLSFALVAHRYVGAFGQSLGQRTLVASNERRVAARLFEERIGAIPSRTKEHLGTALRWNELGAIARDLRRDLDDADALRAGGNFYEAELVFNRARKTHFERRMLPWFDRAIEDQRVAVDALESRAIDEAKTLRVAGNALAIVAALLASVSVFALLRAVVHPVGLLVRGAEAIARGDLSHRIVYEGADELGVLAARFNEMADAIGKSRAALIEKNVALEDAYKLQSDFLSIVSHELRSPLNAIIGYTELILDDFSELSERGRKNVASIATGARRLLALINDILDFSKLRAGQMRARIDAFHPMEVATIVVEDGKALAQGRSVEVRLESNGDPGQMRSDETKVRQILTNLVSNAVKFTDTGSVTVRVERPTAEHVSFSVSDTGIGIPEAQQGIIFEPFRQAQGADRRAFGGTGLGLAIVKRLSDLLGGRVDVRSVVGQGTEFTVVLPVQLEASHGEDPDHR